MVMLIGVRLSTKLEHHLMITLIFQMSLVLLLTRLLMRISRISGMEVLIGNETLPISHPRKNEFIARFVEFTESKKK